MTRRPAASDDVLDEILSATRRVHEELRNDIRGALAGEPLWMAGVSDDSAAGDTIYEIDRVCEARLFELLAEHFARWLPVIVVAEGLPDAGHGEGVAVMPPGADCRQSRLCLVVDPIDGTRGLMYGKRSAWILTGIVIRQKSTPLIPRLSDIDVAVQTEVPPVKQTYADTLWAVRGRGAFGQRTDLTRDQHTDITLAPSRAKNIEHGFGQVMRAFPGGRDILAAVDDDICLGALGPGQAGKAKAFEDQYISTAGQIAELAYGHDRWCADLRPLLAPVLAARGQTPLLCCHPYDICTALVAEELGILISTPAGDRLDPPLQVHHDVAWVGYANKDIRAQVEPLLRASLRKHRLMP